MGLTNYVSTYQHDFSGRDKGFRSRSRSMSAANLVNATQISPPAILRNGNYKTNNGYNRGLSESKGVTIDGREVSSRPVYQRSSKSYTEKPSSSPTPTPTLVTNDPIWTFPSSFFQVVNHGSRRDPGVTIDGRSANYNEGTQRIKRISKSQNNLHRYDYGDDVYDEQDSEENGVTIDGRSAPQPDYPKKVEKFYYGETSDGAPVAIPYTPKGVPVDN